MCLFAAIRLVSTIILISFFTYIGEENRQHSSVKYDQLENKQINNDIIQLENGIEVDKRSRINLACLKKVMYGIFSFGCLFAGVFGFTFYIIGF